MTPRDQSFRPVTVADVVTIYLDQLRGKAPDSVRSQLRPIVRILGPLVVNELRGFHLEQYRAAREDEGISPSTQNRELGYLRAALKKAVSLEIPGVDRIPTVTMVREPEGRTGWFSEEQMLATAHHLDGEHRPLGDVARWAFYSGWRKAAVCGLPWTAVDVERGIVEMPKELAKSRRSVRLPIEGPIVEILQRRLADNKYGCVNVPWIFHRNGQPVKSFDKSWKTATKAAGCEGRIFHDLRRSFVLYMMAKGVAETHIMRIADMTRPTLERYLQTRVEDLQEAMRQAHKDKEVEDLRQAMERVRRSRREEQ